MKFTSAIFLLSSAAIAAPLVSPEGVYHGTAPVRVELGGVVYTVGNDGFLLARGWRVATQSEIDADAAARALAASNALAAASLPAVFANGIATMDEDGHWVELLPTGDGLPIIGVQVSNSPLTAEQRAQMKAQRKATHDALKAEAKAAKNDKDKIALLMRAVFGKDAQ